MDGPKRLGFALLFSALQSSLIFYSTNIQMEKIVNSRESLRQYLERGGDAQIKDEFGQTLLHYAARRPAAADVIEYLIVEHGLKPNQKTLRRKYELLSEVTPLYLAVLSGHLENAKALINNGGNVNTRFPEKDTLLSLAARTTNPPMIQLLLDAGAETNYKDGDGLSALAYVTLSDCGERAGEQGYYQKQRNKMAKCIESAKVLIAGGEDPNSVSNSGGHVISHAARKMELVRTLASLGANPEPLRNYFERLNLPMEQFEELERLYSYSKRRALIGLRTHLLNLGGGRRLGRKQTRRAKKRTTSKKRRTIKH